MRFGERVAERGAERPRENICRPKKNASGNLRRQVKNCHKGDQPGENQCAAFKAEPQIISCEIAERGTQRIGNENREPIKGLIRTRFYLVDGEPAPS